MNIAKSIEEAIDAVPGRDHFNTSAEISPFLESLLLANGHTPFWWHVEGGRGYRVGDYELYPSDEVSGDEIRVYTFGVFVCAVNIGKTCHERLALMREQMAWAAAQKEARHVHG